MWRVERGWRKRQATLTDRCRFNRQGNLPRRLSLGGCKANRTSLCHQNLKIYVEALTGLRHICHPDGLNSTSLSQDYFLGQHLGAGKASGTHIRRTGKEVRSLWLPESSSLVTWWSHPLSDLPQQTDFISWRGGAAMALQRGVPTGMGGSTGAIFPHKSLHWGKGGKQRWKCPSIPNVLCPVLKLYPMLKSPTSYWGTDCWASAFSKSEFLIQYIWDKAWECASLKGPQMVLAVHFKK